MVAACCWQHNYTNSETKLQACTCWTSGKLHCKICWSVTSFFETTLDQVQDFFVTFQHQYSISGHFRTWKKIKRWTSRPARILNNNNNTLRTSISCRWRTAQRAASRQMCCKQRWTLSVTNFLRPNEVNNTCDGRHFRVIASYLLKVAIWVLPRCLASEN